MISITSSFAATWLVPRLGRFVSRHPRVEVRIDTGSELIPIGHGAGRADLAVCHGLGEWPGLEAVRLLQPRLIPVGSVQLLAAGPPVREASDCLHYKLLHDAQGADWSLWLQALGGDHRDPRARRGTRFSDGTLLIRAAAAGQGLALVRDTYVADDIAAGRLTVAFDAPWPARFAYYVVTRAGPGLSPPVVSFRDWLLEEAASAS